MNTGLLTKSYEAFSIDDYELVGLNLHRALLTNTMILIPSFIVLYFSDNICLLLGFDIEVATYAQYMLIRCLPGIFCLMIYTTITSYLNSCNFSTAPRVIQVIALAVFWITMYMSSERLGLGLAGVAISFNMMYISAVIMMITYVKFRDPIPMTFFWFRRESFQGIFEFLNHNLTAGSMVFIEWIALEVFYLFSVGLNQEEMAAFTIAYSNLSIILIIPMALSDTVLTFVSDAIHDKDAPRAQKFFRAGLLMNSPCIDSYWSFIYYLY